MQRAYVKENINLENVPHVAALRGTLIEVQQIWADVGGWGIRGGALILSHFTTRMPASWFHYIDALKFPIDPNAPKN